MKRFLFVLAVSAVIVPALQPARAADVSINYFYDNLNGGNWYEVADYGYVWQPDVASNPNWRPYTDGYWAYTDVGWTWVSYEDFGWATYHYGRWARLADYGWVWVPGYEWGPAWVSWRTGGDYVGWAPLPPANGGGVSPGGGEAVYESRPIDYRVDAEYDIGPAYYNFIDLRYIGEPVLRDRIFPWDQNIGYIDRTVNVTNITFSNGLVYNYGPDYSFVSAYSVRPVQRLRLERANIDPFQAVKTGNVTKVQGDKLVLAAPAKLQRPATQIAPPKLKAKIDQPKLEKGWANVDPSTKSKLEQKFKTENPKNIPKPNIAPKAGANAPNVNAPAGTAAPAGAMAGQGKGKRKGEKFQNQPGALTAPGASPAAPGAAQQEAKGKNKGRAVQNQPNQPADGSPEPTAAERAKGKKNKAQQSRGQANPAGAGAGTAAEQPGLGAGAGKGKRKAERAEPTTNSNNAPANVAGEGKHNRKLERANEPVTNSNGPPKPPQAGEARAKGGGRTQNEGLNQPGGGNHRGQVQAPPTAAGPQPGQAQGKGKGKKNKGQAPPPQ